LTIKKLIKRIFGLKLYGYLRRWRYNIPLSRKEAFGIDMMLEDKLPHRDGFYVELGANDGVRFSNSYYFEVNKGWKGVLIEPAPNLYVTCKKKRGANNVVFCNACVPFDYKEEFVRMKYCDSMTISDNLDLDIGDHDKFVESGEQFLNEGESPFIFGAKSATLNSLLKEAKAPALIDFLTLDVEGASLEVLKGVDFSKYNFRYMVIECRDIDKMNAYLVQFNYSLGKKITVRDYLFKYKTD
jgi:FkbM family methyltransferase